MTITDLKLLSAKNSKNWVYDFLKLVEIKHKYGWPNKPLSGESVKVAIIDNGLNIDDGFEGRSIEKYDLTGKNGEEALRLIKNSDEFKKIKQLKKYNFEENYGNDNNDLHGSHIASIIGGTNGIANKCNLLILNVHNKGIKKRFLPLAVYYAISQGAQIINISQDAATCSQALKDAVNFAYYKNVFIVCGAGNTNSADGLTIEFPAAYQKTFAIGGYKECLEFYSKGDRGKLLDFMAPAENIISPLNGDSLAGTSYASAIVSGILSLFLEKYKNKSNGANIFPKYHELKRILLERAVHPNYETCINDWGYHDENWGYGIIHPISLFKCFDE